MTEAKTKRAYIIADFRDAGSETEYKAGDTITLPEGEFANFEAAGLVRTPTTQDKASAKDS